jgi:aspartyl protease family protein
MWKQVAPLFVLAVLVGWFMPAGNPSPSTDAALVAPPTSAQSPPAQAQAPAVASQRTSTGEVVLDRAADGHFYAAGNADGAAVKFLIDTGASVVALTEGDAERLGQYWHPGELTVVGRGVNGTVQGKQILVKRLTIGDLSADNVPAVIIPDGLHVSLLGQSFLSRVGSVSIAENRMTLKN